MKKVHLKTFFSLLLLPIFNLTLQNLHQSSAFLPLKISGVKGKKQTVNGRKSKKEDGKSAQPLRWVKCDHDKI